MKRVQWAKSLRRIAVAIIATRSYIRRIRIEEPTAAKEDDEEKRRQIIKVTTLNTKLRAYNIIFHTRYVGLF